MKHAIMFYAGYKHLECNKRDHTHKLLNLQTNEVEIWITCRCELGIPYKNTHLAFKDVEGRYYESIQTS